MYAGRTGAFPVLPRQHTLCLSSRLTLNVARLHRSLLHWRLCFFPDQDVVAPWWFGISVLSGRNVKEFAFESGSLHLKSFLHLKYFITNKVRYDLCKTASFLQNLLAKIPNDRTLAVIRTLRTGWCMNILCHRLHFHDWCLQTSERGFLAGVSRQGPGPEAGIVRDSPCEQLLSYLLWPGQLGAALMVYMVDSRLLVRQYKRTSTLNLWITNL